MNPARMRTMSATKATKRKFVEVKISSPPTFVILLDKGTAATRWHAVVDAFADNIATFVNRAMADVDTATQGILFGLQYLLTKDSICYYDELVAIATQLELPLFKVVAMQLVYEASTLCTSLSHPGRLSRTVDWEDQTQAMRDLTVILEFQRDGKTVAKAASFAGFVGILTGMTPTMALSVNYRASGSRLSITSDSIQQNIQRLLRDLPVAYLTRQVLLSGSEPSAMMHRLKTGSTVTSAYIIVASATEAFVIERDATKHNTRSFADVKCRALVQTNVFSRGPLQRIVSGQTDIADSVARHAKAMELLTADHKIALAAILTKEPILNAGTVHSVDMNISEFELTVAVLSASGSHRKNLKLMNK
jgi:hypothetical protein